MSVVGQSRPRIDAVDRGTGAARYTADVKLPGTAYPRVLRSPHPHARATSIDTWQARELPGVHAVLTRENCDTVWGSGVQQNPRHLFNNPVRFVGDPVPAVAAVDRHESASPGCPLQMRSSLTETATPADVPLGRTGEAPSRGTSPVIPGPRYRTFPMRRD